MANLARDKMYLLLLVYFDVRQKPRSPNLFK